MIRSPVKGFIEGGDLPDGRSRVSPLPNDIASRAAECVHGSPQLFCSPQYSVFEKAVVPCAVLLLVQCTHSTSLCSAFDLSCLDKCWPRGTCFGSLNACADLLLLIRTCCSSGSLPTSHHSKYLAYSWSLSASTQEVFVISSPQTLVLLPQPPAIGMPSTHLPHQRQSSPTFSSGQRKCSIFPCLMYSFNLQQSRFG